MSAVFIRAPKILQAGVNVHELARLNGGIIACEETAGGKYYLALTFHPELTTTLVHEYFLSRAIIDAGGFVVAEGRIHPDKVTAALKDLENDENN